MAVPDLGWTADDYKHLSGFGVIMILLAKEILRVVRKKSTEPFVKRLGDLSVESFEAKMRHTMRNEMVTMLVAMNKNSENMVDSNDSLGQKVDESNDRLEKINNGLIRLVTLVEQKKGF